MPPIRRWSRRQWLVLGVCMALGAILLPWLTLEPSNDRHWAPEQAQMATVTFDGHLVHVTNLRNFAYTAAGQFTAAYDNRDFDLDRIATAWFVLTPFSGH